MGQSYICHTFSSMLDEDIMFLKDEDMTFLKVLLFVSTGACKDNQRLGGIPEAIFCNNR